MGVSSAEDSQVVIDVASHSDNKTSTESELDIGYVDPKEERAFVSMRK